MEKRLILIRHAHRDTSDRSLDNGLSRKGQRQAGRIVRYGEKLILPEDYRKLNGEMVSSPRKRCLETVQDLAKSWKASVNVAKDLDERGETETSAAFMERIHRFLVAWQKNPCHLTIICGHGDWLPLAIFHLIGLSVEMKKGAWLEIEWTHCHGELSSYIPSFKPFYR